MSLFGRPSRPTFGILDPRHALAASALHGAAFAHGWSDIEFERLLAAGSSVADAAFAPNGGPPVGFILSRTAADEAEVLTIVVAARWRGRGIGRQLLSRHVDRLAHGRTAALFLEVEAGNAPALALYLRSGFVEVGRRAAYYAGPPGHAPLDALVLRRPIG